MGKIDLKKLRDAIDYSVRVNEVFRTNLVEFVKEYAGGNWADDRGHGGRITDRDHDNPINLLALYVTVINRRLVGAEPRMSCSTFDRELRPMVEAFEQWGNRKLNQMRFVEILRRSVMNATFLIGITKTCITSPLEARIGGYGKAVGVPGISTIAYEDFLFDVYASCFDECEWKGHVFDADLEDVEKSNLFKRKARLKLVEQEDTLFDTQGNQKLSTIGRSISNNQEYRKKVRLAEVWFRKEQVVVTFDANGDMDEPLLEQDWVGPDSGPYDELIYGEVPDNINPKSPIMDLINLHREQNTLWKKLNNQASNQKTNIMYRDEATAQAHKKAQDQDYIKSQSPDDIREISTGGPNNMVQAFTMMGYQMFNDMAGNIKAVAGLGRQADTATQEKMIVENASEQILAMSQRTAAFTERLMRKLGWFFWHNPYETMNSVYTVPGLPDISAPRKVTPQQRGEKKFEDLDIELDPYSMAYTSPQQKAQIINAFTKEIFIPLAGQFNQPGISDFLQAYVKKVAKLQNIPELVELMESLIGTPQMPQGEDASQGGADPRMPAETTRNYNRTSQSGMTDTGHSQIMQQLLAGGNPQGQGLGNLMKTG